MSEPKSYTKTRVVQSPGYNGQWVVQGWWPDNQVWADLGDPCETYAAALAKQDKIKQEDSK